MHISTRLVASLLFGSGLTSLIYQTAWQRMFRLVFGASTAASAAVLGIFLGGLGLGAVLIGKRAERSERPLAFYGNLELGVALFAAVTPLLVELGSDIYFAVGGSRSLGTGGATVVRLIIAALVMGPSVVLMGGTLPAAARAVESDGDAARSRLALLYAANTLGAVVGALLATFLLFELLGTRLCLWGAALVNLLVAMFARSIGRDAERVPLSVDHSADDSSSDAGPSAGEGASSQRAVPEVAFSEPQVSARFVYVSAGAVGFAFLCSELVWYRMLAPILGGSSFTFGMILAVALLGIGIGGYLYSRRNPETPATLRLLIATILLEALALGVPFALGDGIALYAAHTRALGSSSFGALTFSWLVITSAVVLPAAIISGYQFPVIVALLGRGRRHVGRHVGLAYAFNTMGAIAGALCGGFLLIPRLGAIGTWRFLVLLLVCLGLVALSLNLKAMPLRRWAGSLPLALLALAACLTSMADGPSAIWRHGAIGAGRARIGEGDRNGLIASQRELKRELLWERDGVESAVGMRASDGIGFAVNGKVDGQVRFDRGTQAMLGLAPAALHPAPRTVFVLGLGTGMTAGWVSAVPGVERVDVAELEPAVIEVARAAAPVNQHVLERANVHVFNGDGREFLLTTQQRYDLIVSEPSNPYRVGVASLFTSEFYSAVERRLEEGGIFTQWVQGYEIDAETLRVVLRTLQSVFPVIEIWHTQSDDLMLIASRRPLSYDVPSIRRRLAEEPFRSAFPRMWLVEGAEGLFAHFLATDTLSASVAEAFASPINTDDSSSLEYAFARQVGAPSQGVSLQLFELAAKLDQGRPASAVGLDWDRVRELQGRAWLISHNPSPNLPKLEGAARNRAHAVELGCLQLSSEVLTAWGIQPRPRRQPQHQQPEIEPARADMTGSTAPVAREVDTANAELTEPRDILEVFVLANGYAHYADERALPLADTLAIRGFVAEAQLARARFQAAAGQHEAALAELIRALEELRRTSISLCDTAAETLRMLAPMVRGKPELARQALAAVMVGPLPAYLSERLRISTAQAIAFDLKDSELCVAALAADLYEPGWDRALLEARVDCLERAKHPLLARAEADLRRFIGNTAGRLDDGLNLPVNPDLQSRVTP